MLTEYLYIDQRRLQAYFEQLSPGPFYEKVSNWRVALGLVGPSAEASQTRSARPFTDHERVAKLLEKVRAQPIRQVFRSPAEADLVVATLTARRVVLPQSVSKRPEFKGLALWIAPASDGSPFVALIEDFRGEADHPVHKWSGNSTLQLLFGELGSAAPVDLVHTARQGEPDEWTFNLRCDASDVDYHTSQGLIAEAIRRAGLSNSSHAETVRFSTYSSGMRFEIHVGPHRCEADVSRPANFRAGDAVVVSLRRDRAAAVAGQFVEDPFGTTREWGGELGPERRVDTLFRLRHTLIERDARENPGAVIGYPIFVAQHPSNLFS